MMVMSDVFNYYFLVSHYIKSFSSTESASIDRVGISVLTVTDLLIDGFVCLDFADSGNTVRISLPNGESAHAIEFQMSLNGTHLIIIFCQFNIKLAVQRRVLFLYA